MGVDTKIQWTDHSWSPWRGCTKVSPGCTNCYAESLSHRNPKVLGVWGPDGHRAIAGDTAYRQLTAWNRAAAKAMEYRRIFPSLCDPFEDRDDLIGPRNQFFSAIHTTPNLIYLLLTKRPENIARLWPPSYPKADHPWWNGRLWLGTSVEDQRRADERIPALLEIPAAMRFLSVEPLLGPIDLGLWRVAIPKHRESWPAERVRNFWVIVGGESGPGARPCDLAWIRSIRDQCKAAGVACFIKQIGTRPFVNRNDEIGGSIHCTLPFRLRDPKGGNWDEWPSDLRIREFPNPAMEVAR